MLNLKNSLLLIAFLCLSCVTKKSFEITSFHDEKISEDFQVVKVSSYHVKQECLFYDAEDENKWRHQYMMYILNDQKEVIEVLHGVNQTKSVCMAQLKSVSKILKQSSEVSLCLRGALKKDLINSEFQIFNGSEKYPIRYEFLTFDSICNSKNCFSVNDVWTHTCPGFKKY